MDRHSTKEQFGAHGIKNGRTSARLGRHGFAPQNVLSAETAAAVPTATQTAGRETTDFLRTNVAFVKDCMRACACRDVNFASSVPAC